MSTGPHRVIWVALFVVALVVMTLPPALAEALRSSGPSLQPATSADLPLASVAPVPASRVQDVPLAGPATNASAWWPCPLCGPPSRANASFLTDSAKGDLFLEGGYSQASGYYPDAWTFRNGHWLESFHFPNIGRRQGAAAAYDPTSGKMVFFGGLYGWDSNDTWLFDGTSWSQPACGSTCPPPPRFGASMVFDAHDHYLLLFGGRACVDFSCPLNSSLMNDSWKFQGGVWSPIPATRSPPARAWASMSYDARDGYVVLSGGEDGSLLSDTWEYQAGTWTNVTAIAGVGPGSRAFASTAYDPVLARVVVFGGLTPSGPSNDVWQFAGAAWNPVPIASGPAPGARTGASLAYDPSLGDLALVGGVGLNGRTNPVDLWELRGDRWFASPVVASPSDGQVMTYDAGDHYQLLFGGGSFGLLGNATYKFQNGTWTDLSSSIATPPGPRFETQMTYDTKDGYAVLFGGYGCFLPSCAGGIFGQGPLNDTWTFSGGAWTKRATPVAPPTTENGGLAYDSTDKVVVLLTECSCSVITPVTETWTFTAGNWTNVTSNQTVQPTFGVGFAAMADSPWDKGVILFGGQGTNSTWLFSNGTWSNVSSSAGKAPSTRYESAFAPDSTLGAPVLVGGLLQSPCSTCLPTVNDTWEFYHGQWQNISANQTPWPRPTMQIADDPADGGLLLWGMSGGTNAVDTWTFGPGPNLTAEPQAVPAKVDASLPVQLFAGISGGRSPYTLNWTSGNRSLGSTSPLSLLLGPPANYSVHLHAADAANDSVNGSTSVEVVANLTVLANVSATHAVAGVALHFAGSSHGGVGPFLPIWRFGDGGWSTSANGTHRYAAPGSYVAWFWTNDSAGASAGISLAIDVTPTLSNAVQLSTNDTDVGVRVRFNATPLGGAPPVQESWNFGDGSTATGEYTALHGFAAPGYYTVTAWANDSAGGSVPATTFVTVHALPTVSVVASGPVDLGQTLHLQAFVANGTGPFSVTWQGLPQGCLPGLGWDFYCLPSATGDIYVESQVTDGAGISVNSSFVRVTVYGAVAGTVQVAPASIDVGQNATISVAVTGGAPPVAVSYTGLPPGCPATALLRFACTPSGAVGKFVVRAVLHDGAGETVTTAGASWTVNASLSVVLWSSASELSVGDNLTLRAMLTGGSAPYTYEFSGLPTGCPATSGPAIGCAPTGPGSFDVHVRVGDAAHENFSANATVLVDPIASTSAAPSNLGSVGEFILVGVAVLLAAVALLWVVRRRRTKPEEPTDPDEPV